MTPERQAGHTHLPLLLLLERAPHDRHDLHLLLVQMCLHLSLKHLELRLHRAESAVVSHTGSSSVAQLVQLCMRVYEQPKRPDVVSASAAQLVTYGRDSTMEAYDAAHSPKAPRAGLGIPRSASQP